MGPEIVWQGLGPSLIGTVMAAVVGLEAVRRSNLGAERNARQGRLEEALAQLILGVSAAYVQPAPVESEPELRSEPWVAPTADARVKILLLTESTELDVLTGEVDRPVLSQRGRCAGSSWESRRSLDAGDAVACLLFPSRCAAQ